MSHADVAIIGGGIVGAAVAYNFTERFPNRHVVLLEKEASLGAHQTGHNSGVLHSGVYYKPGSLKAKNCRAGKEAMEAFCEKHELAYDICGKVIVAVEEREIPALEKIHERGRQNEVQCEMIDQHRLAELEPHAAGVRAIHVPEAGIVDFRQVCLKMAELVRQREGRVVASARVTGVRKIGEELTVETTQGPFTAEVVVNCGGLHSDRVSRLCGDRPDFKVLPFRGEFYQLKPEAEHLCNNLIYPVPDPRFPFLGVHFTRMIHGGVECGPNAVLAWAREGYRKGNVNLRDLFESITYLGFLRMAAKYWRVGLGEMWRSYNKGAFVRALQRLVPEIRSENLVTARSGVRAQAISPDGGLIDDFLIRQCGQIIHVDNAPSPAATTSLNVGKLVVDKLASHFS